MNKPINPARRWECEGPLGLVSYGSTLEEALARNAKRHGVNLEFAREQARDFLLVDRMESKA